MPIYAKKPITIEAIQYKNDHRGNNIKEIFEFVEKTDSIDSIFSKNTELFIKTPEGNMKVNIDDYIIRSIKDTFCPCNPDIFEAMYNMVDSEVEGKNEA